MSGRKINFERMHEIELEYMFEHEIGKGSLVQQVDDELYTLAKQKFVSNLNGTVWTEPILVISLLPITFISINALYHYLRISRNIILSSHAQFMTEFIVLVLPTILIFCNESTWSILMILSVHIAFLLIIITLSNIQSLSIFSLDLNALPHGCYQRKKSYISLFRTILMIYTILSILAVDFTVFPRRFAKCETYGFSVMDLGVGSFIVALGVISVVKRRGIPNELQRNVRNFFVAFRSSMPLFVFGVLRFVLTWMVGYHAHVSEYGVHWNFFFTIFVVSFTSFFLNIQSENGFYVAVTLSIAHQTFLSLYGSEYVLHTERVSGNFISENKEGLVSCVGYFICYHSGRSIGYYLSKHTLQNKRGVSHLMVELILMLFVIVGLCWFMHQFIENTSRRLTNVAYILYVVGCDLWIILLFLFASFVLSHGNGSILLQSINANQLFSFLFANVLTGIINLSFKTLFAVPWVSYALIVTYMFVICAVCYLLYLKKIKIKL